MPGDYLVATTLAEAWALYHQHQAEGYGYPIRVGDVWHVHRAIGKVAEAPPVQGMSMAEYVAKFGPVKAPPSPGGSVKAQQLKPEDKPRIEARVQKAAEKRKAEAEAAAEEERRRQAQPTFSLEG